jgi:hypothetical protein
VELYPSEAVTTEAPRQVWEYAYGEPWPEGWRVRWVTDHRYRGVTLWERKLIQLSWTVPNTMRCILPMNH